MLYSNGELFIGQDSDVTTSGTGIGLNSDTLQKGEVLDMDFYTSNPKGNALAADAEASTIFFKFQNFGSDDIVVILKLVDADNPLLTTTRAIIVDNGDFYTQASPPPAGFGITFNSGTEGAVIIESNDYNTAPVIIG